MQTGFHNKKYFLKKDEKLVDDFSEIVYIKKNWLEIYKGLCRFYIKKIGQKFPRGISYKEPTPTPPSYPSSFTLPQRLSHIIRAKPMPSNRFCLYLLRFSIVFQYIYPTPATYSVVCITFVLRIVLPPHHVPHQPSTPKPRIGLNYNLLISYSFYILYLLPFFVIFVRVRLFICCV